MPTSTTGASPRATRFPATVWPTSRPASSGFPVLLQRLGLRGGLPAVNDGHRLRDLPIVQVYGSEDPAHTAAIERQTADLLRSWGARVCQPGLAEQAITVNRHFLSAEDNADEVLALVRDLTDEHVTR